MLFPDFFIPGAPKAGTTTLALWLATHPQVSFSVPKEPRYFNKDFSLYGRPENLEEYLSLFPPKPDGGLRGEATTSYLASDVAIDHILELNPNAKFIVCLRDPRQLFISLHRQRLKEGYETLMHPQEAWNAIDARMQGLDLPLGCPDPQLLNYARFVKIGDQLEELFSKVKRSNVLCLLSEDLEQDPQKSFDAVCRFLGISKHHIDHTKRANQARIPKSVMIARLLRLVGLLKQRLGITRNLGIASVLNSVNLKPPTKEIVPLLADSLLIELEGQYNKAKEVSRG